MPFSLDDNEEIRELLQEMDSKYEVPHQKGVFVCVVLVLVLVSSYLLV